MKVKILLFDIENTPIVTYAWGIHDDPTHSTKFVKDEWKMMCWAAKWLGEKKIYSENMYGKKDDKPLLKKLWKLLDEADIVIAHNGRKFDVRKANARFIQHGMGPTSPYRIIDTLTESRKHFMFTSNRLGDLGHYLGVGAKLETRGFDLWLDCMADKKPAWDKMIKYCKNDVVLLEKVYLKLRPYMKTHPNLSIIENSGGCSKCGSKDLIGRGYAYTNAGKKHRYQCKNCWGYGAYKLKYGEVTQIRSL